MVSWTIGRGQSLPRAVLPERLSLDCQHQSDTSCSLNFHIRIIGKELAELADKHIQAAGSEKVVFRLPATAQDGFAADDLILVFGEKLQNFGFRCGQYTGFTRVVITQGGMYGVERVMTEPAVPLYRPAFGTFLHLQDGMDVRINLFRDKWLLHVVVHPQFVAMPHILGRGQGGSEQDGRVPVRLPDTSHHLEAVHSLLFRLHVL